METRKPGRLGCENCRSRRIKCNQLRPRCSQCARAGLQCSGYRSAIDLLFRDQTASVSQKYDQYHSETRDNNTKLSHSIRLAPAHLPMYSTPQMPVEEVAWWYYNQNFNIMHPSCAPVHRPYVGDVSLVASSITSVGLAALAVVHGDPHLMQLARRKYSLVLRLLRCAVVDPEKIRQPTTATTSFNLSMFEVIFTDGARSTSYNWLRHMQGTVALLHSLQLSEGTSTAEIRSLLQISFTAALACLICGNPVPSFLLSLVQRAAKTPNGTSLSATVNLFTLLCDLVNLHLRTISVSSQDVDRSEIITTALTAYQSVLAWTTSLPKDWIDPLQTNAQVHNQLQFKGLAQVKGQPPLDECWIMRVWVYYRLCCLLSHKIIVDSIILDRSLSLPCSNTKVNVPIFQQQYDSSMAIIAQASRELYLGVPAMLSPSSTMGSTTPTLSSNVFFLITILQTMGELTGRQPVVANWSLLSKTYGEGFGVVRGLILRRL